MEEKKPAVYVPPSKRGLIGAGGAAPAKAKAQASVPSSTSQFSDKEKKIRAVKKVT